MKRECMGLLAGVLLLGACGKAETGARQVVDLDGKRHTYDIVNLQQSSSAGVEHVQYTAVVGDRRFTTEVQYDDNTMEATINGPDGYLWVRTDQQGAHAVLVTDDHNISLIGMGGGKMLSLVPNAAAISTSDWDELMIEVESRELERGIVGTLRNAGSLLEWPLLMRTLAEVAPSSYNQLSYRIALMYGYLDADGNISADYESLALQSNNCTAGSGTCSCGSVCSGANPQCCSYAFHDFWGNCQTSCPCCPTGKCRYYDGIGRCTN